MSLTDKIRREANKISRAEGVEYAAALKKLRDRWAAPLTQDRDAEAVCSAQQLAEYTAARLEGQRELVTAANELLADEGVRQ